MNIAWARAIVCSAVLLWSAAASAGDYGASHAAVSNLFTVETRDLGGSHAAVSNLFTVETRDLGGTHAAVSNLFTVETRDLGGSHAAVSNLFTVETRDLGGSHAAVSNLFTVETREMDAFPDVALGSWVMAIAETPDGGVLAGGNMRVADEDKDGETELFHLAKLDAMGGLDMSWGVVAAGTGGGAHHDVRALARHPQGGIWVAGRFDTLGGVARGGLALLDADGNHDPTFAEPTTLAPAPSGYNRRLAVTHDGYVYAAGMYSPAPMQASRIIRLHPDGTLDESFAPPVLFTIHALVPTESGKLYVVGRDLLQVSMASHLSILRLLPDGSIDPTFADPFNTPDTSVSPVVYCAAEDTAGRLVVGGSFARIDGQTRNLVARLLPDGTLDPDFTPQLVRPQAGINAVWALAVLGDGSLIVGGNHFESPHDSNQQHLLRLFDDGSVDPDFSVRIEGGESHGGPLVSALLATPTGFLYVGGAFDTLDGREGALHCLTGLPEGMEITAPVFARNPAALEVMEGQAAMFDVEVEGTPAAVIRWYRAASQTVPIGIGPVLELTEVTEADADIYWAVASSAGGTVLSRSARLTVLPDPNRPGRRVEDYSPHQPNAFLAVESGDVRALAAMPDGSVVVAGDFRVTVAVGKRRKDGGIAQIDYLYRLTPDGRYDETFQPGGGPDDRVWDAIADSAGRVVLAGPFRHYDGVPVPGLVRLLPDGSRDPAFAPELSGDWREHYYSVPTGLIVHAIAPAPDGGVFACINLETSGLWRTGVLRFHADGSVHTPMKLGHHLTRGGTRIAPMPDGGVVSSAGERLRSDLTLDQTYNQKFAAWIADWEALYWATFSFWGNAVAVDGAGNVYFGGTNGAFKTYTLFKLAPDGSVDADFRTHANASLRVNELHEHIFRISALACLPGGRMAIASAGLLAPDDPAGFFHTGVVVLDGEGKRDPHFLPKVQVQNAPWSADLHALAHTNDGKLVLGGRFSTLNGHYQHNPSVGAIRAWTPALRHITFHTGWHGTFAAGERQTQIEALEGSLLANVPEVFAAGNFIFAGWHPAPPAIVQDDLETRALYLALLHLEPGWNLVSLPLAPLDPSVDEIFSRDNLLEGGRSGGTVHQGPVWRWHDGRYRLATELTALEGVWLFATEGGTLVVEGTAVEAPARDLLHGWNLAGPPVAMPPPADPRLQDRWWTHCRDSQELIQAQPELEPGHGYWLFALEPFLLELAPE